MRFLLFCTLVLLNRRGLTLHGPSIQQLTKPFELGEGPTWDARTQLLYFVNIFEGQLLSYNPRTNVVNAIDLPGTVTPVILTKSSTTRFIVGLNRTLLAVEWDGINELFTTQTLTEEVSKQFPTSMFDDGKADKQGRLWIGTMGAETSTGFTPDEGVLYFFDKHTLKDPTPVIHPVTISNGLTWNKANNKFYYIDSPTLKVVEYEYNDALGKISNPKVIFDLRNHKKLGGMPDGMTIDKDDNLWIALYQGGAVIKVNPKTGDLLQVVAIPAEAVTSVAWGGPNLDILFVTTSYHPLTPEERRKQPAAGSLFAVSRLGTSGVEPYYANL